MTISLRINAPEFVRPFVKKKLLNKHMGTGGKKRVDKPVRNTVGSNLSKI